MQPTPQQPPNTPAAPAKKPNEQGRILVQDHFRITDPETKQEIVKGRG
jgi:hypothetical protein